MDVTVIVTTRNRSALLATTLLSVLRQRAVDFEVIVVDEASSDETPAFLAALDDRRVRVIHHDTPYGLSAARNHGADEARGEWLAFLDDDDLWAPDKLARQISMAADRGREWVYTGAVNIADGRITRSQPPPTVEEVVATLPRYNAIPGGGSNVIVHRTAWLDVGPFDTRLRRGGEDWELSIRLAKHGLPACVYSPLVAKRLHASNMFGAAEEIVRATKVIEGIHHTGADWGRIHHWLAHISLREGRRATALKHFALAAVRGQLQPVASDLSQILKRRLGSSQSESAGTADPWAAAAAAWLRDIDEQLV